MSTPLPATPKVSFSSTPNPKRNILYQSSLSHKLSINHLKGEATLTWHYIPERDILTHAAFIESIILLQDHPWQNWEELSIYLAYTFYQELLPHRVEQLLHIIYPDGSQQHLTTTHSQPEFKLPKDFSPLLT